MVDPKATFNYSPIRFSAIDSLLIHYNSVNMDYPQMVNYKQCSVASPTLGSSGCSLKADFSSQSSAFGTGSFRSAQKSVFRNSYDVYTVKFENRDSLTFLCGPHY